MKNKYVSIFEKLILSKFSFTLPLMADEIEKRM